MADVPSLSSVRQSVTPQGVRRTLGMELEPAVEADSVSPPTYTTAVALPTAPATPAGVVQLVKQAQAEIKKKVDSSEVAAMFVNEATQDMIRQILRENLKDVDSVTTKMKQNIEAELMTMLTAVAEQVEGNMKTKVTSAFTPFFDSISILVSQIKTFEKEDTVQDSTEAAAHAEFISIMKRIEVHAAIKTGLEKTKLQQIAFQESEAQAYSTAWASDPAAAAKVVAEGDIDKHIQKTTAAITLKITQIRHILTDLGCSEPLPSDRHTKSLAASDLKDLRGIKLNTGSEDPEKSLKLRELIVNVLAQFTYDCWAIYPAIFRLLNLRVHADRWSPPTNDQMAVPEGETYDSEGTGIGIHTRLAYISQNENLYRLLLQSSEETVRWATEGDRLASDGNSYTRQICGRVGDGISVLEYLYFRHEQTSGNVREKVRDALLIAHGEFQKKNQTLDDSCKIIRHFAKRAVDLDVQVTYNDTVGKIIRTIVATRPSLGLYLHSLQICSDKQYVKNAAPQISAVLARVLHYASLENSVTEQPRAMLSTNDLFVADQISDTFYKRADPSFSRNSIIGTRKPNKKKKGKGQDTGTTGTGGAPMKCAVKGCSKNLSDRDKTSYKSFNERRKASFEAKNPGRTGFDALPICGACRTDATRNSKTLILIDSARNKELQFTPKPRDSINEVTDDGDSQSTDGGSMQSAGSTPVSSVTSAQSMEVTELKKEMSALRELLIRPAQAPAPAVDEEGAKIAQLLKQAGFSDEQLANRLK